MKVRKDEASMLHASALGAGPDGHSNADDGLYGTREKDEKQPSIKSIMSREFANSRQSIGNHKITAVGNLDHSLS